MELKHAGSAALVAAHPANPASEFERAQVPIERSPRDCAATVGLREAHDRFLTWVAIRLPVVATKASEHAEDS